MSILKVYLFGNPKEAYDENRKIADLLKKRTKVISIKLNPELVKQS